jgi:hypothetical protein
MFGSLMDFASDERIPPGWFGIRLDGKIITVQRYHGVPPFTAGGAVILFNPAELDANTKAIIDALNKTSVDADAFGEQRKLGVDHPAND